MVTATSPCALTLCQSLEELDHVNRRRLTRMRILDGIDFAHDLLLRQYLPSDESKELSKSFGEKRDPDPDTFGH